MYHRTAKLSWKGLVPALLAVVLLFASVGAGATSSIYAGQQQSNRAGRATVNQWAGEGVGAGGASRQRPHPRELMVSEDPQAESQVRKRLIDTERSTRQQEGDPYRPRAAAQGAGASTASGQQQSVGAAGAGSATSNVRLTIRDIGPETGVSGSGSGFIFNRDTRQVILPTPRRVFRSLNAGGQWSPLDLAVGLSVPRTDGSYFVRQDPRNPQTLYAATAYARRLVRSSDFGTTWTQLGDWQLTNVADVAIHEASPNVLLVLTIGGISVDGLALWRSEDGGATFTPQWDSGLPQDIYDPDTGEYFDPNFSNIATTPADPNIVYVVQHIESGPYPAGIHKSTDGGLTFARLEASPSGNPLQVFPHPTRPEVLFVQVANPRNSAIYRSLDGGASFQLVSGGLTNQNFFVAFDRNNPSLVYVAGRGGVFRSEDGGETFQPLGLTAEQLGGLATNVNVDPSNSQVIYVNTLNGNFKSVNGGFTFRAINDGWKAAAIRHIAYDNSSEPNLYLATGSGIMRTNTRGHHYERVPHPSILNTTALLAVAPSDPGMILAATSRGTLYRTLDGGRSWARAGVDTGLVYLSPAWSEMLVDPKDSNNVYFTLTDWPQPNGFYKSVDAGATFERTYYQDNHAGLPDDPDRTPDDDGMRALAIDPLHMNVIFTAWADVVHTSVPLLKSVDGGLSFAPAGSLFNTAYTDQILVAPNNPNNIFIAGYFEVDPSDPWSSQHGIMRSTDGGATWSPADAGLLASPVDLVMNPEDPARLYSWDGAGLHMTTDGGNTWNLLPADELSKALGFEGNQTLLINPKKPNLIYVLGSSLFEVEIHSN